MIIESIKSEYSRYKTLAEKAIAQVQDEHLHVVLGDDSNSIAVVLNHLSGNLKSRFTGFLTEDGEKPWRDRDQEFEAKSEGRERLMEKWNEAWRVLRAELDHLSDADLGKVVTIRGVPHTVSEALERSLTHTAYHVGQIVLIARFHVGSAWQSLSIPRGASTQFNQNLARERQPR